MDLRHQESEMNKTQATPNPAVPAVSRRRLFVASGATGALAAAAVVLPLSPAAPTVEAGATAPAEASGGYQLTAHVQRYYQTARV